MTKLTMPRNPPVPRTPSSWPRSLRTPSFLLLLAASAAPHRAYQEAVDYIRRRSPGTEGEDQINGDDKLKAVFNGKAKVSMFEMTKLVSGHVSK